MDYQLINSKLGLVVSSLGAQLMSLKDDDGIQYIWQGDESTWNRRAPILFPVIGALKDEKYIYSNKEYKINRHGFLRDMEASVDYYDNTRISLTFKSDENTIKHYPFDFELTVMYELSGESVLINYILKNSGTKKMYFALGFHPGFRLPLSDSSKFEDYFLDLGDTEDVKRLGITKEGLLNGNEKEFKNKKINLSREIFADEAIVLKNTSKMIELSSDKLNKSLIINYPDMDYLTLWTLDDNKAEFICIEPWSSLIGESDRIMDIEDIKGILSVEPGDFYKNEISIQIVDK